MPTNSAPTPKDQLTEFLLYTSPSGAVKVEVFLHNENIWLTQDRIAELFGVQRPAITKHLGNIFKDGELQEDLASSILEHTASDEKKYQTKFYNLDAIIAVGYRVNSKKATQFRIWATERLQEYIIKGFAMDDERLKNGKYFGKDYFRELLERIRSIRASERKIYQQITDIFAECSIDYDKNSEIAKNYLEESEIKKLERTIAGYFDYIERLIENRTSFTMKELAESVNKFLEFNEYQVLDGKGKVSHQEAEQKAFAEYQEFNKTQKIESDFDHEVKKFLKKI